MNEIEELKIIRDDITKLQQTLNTLETNVSFLRDSAELSLFNDVKLSDEQSFLIALHYKNNKEILIKLLKTEMEIIMQRIENLNLEKNNVDKYWNFSLNKIVNGELFADLNKARRHKRQLKSQCKTLKKQLKHINDNLNSELNKVKRIKLKMNMYQDKNSGDVYFTS